MSQFVRSELIIVPLLIVVDARVELVIVVVPVIPKDSASASVRVEVPK